ncbi:MAG: TatD family hydrolase [Bacteroidales bacterium]|nr:TatD family hydrolase [Bacteroidales bacterium]
MITDIHTHKIVFNSFSIVDISDNFNNLQNVNFFSIGIHPKFIDNNYENILLEISKLADNQNCKAIGECGIDIYSNFNINIQKSIFIKQIEIAQHKHKPIIIHCVKAYSEIISALKITKFQFPIILHSYNGNLHDTQQFLRYENVFFSFSDKCKIPNCGAQKSLKFIPINKILVETDNSDFKIDDTVKFISTFSNLDYNTLINSINTNFEKIIKVS